MSAPGKTATASNDRLIHATNPQTTKRITHNRLDKAPRRKRNVRSFYERTGKSSAHPTLSTASAKPRPSDASLKVVIAGGKADESVDYGLLLTQLRASNRGGQDAR
jgi:hypothetical protein